MVYHGLPFLIIHQPDENPHFQSPGWAVPKPGPCTGTWPAPPWRRSSRPCRATAVAIWTQRRLARGYQPMAVLNVLKGEGFLCHGQVIDYALHPYLGMRRNNSICHGDLHIHICICMYIYIFYLFIHAYAPTVRIPVMGCRGKKQGPWLITMLPIKHVFFEWYTVVYGYMVYSILRHTHMKHGILLHVENHKSTGWRQF